MLAKWFEFQIMKWSTSHAMHQQGYIFFYEQCFKTTEPISQVRKSIDGGVVILVQVQPTLEAILNCVSVIYSCTCN